MDRPLRDSTPTQSSTKVGDTLHSFPFVEVGALVARSKSNAVKKTSGDGALPLRFCSGLIAVRIGFHWPLALLAANMASAEAWDGPSSVRS